MRVGPMVDRLEGVAAVGGGTYLLAEHNRIRPAEPAGDKLVARILLADGAHLVGV